MQRWLGAERKTRLDDLATVIFSSGSTGDPKGVRLSHYNIGSNIEQLEQVFGLNHQDGFLGILPFFHSFGFTGTLCLPAMLGVGVVYHPNPLDAKAIGPLVRDHRLTFLLATPTFLQLYLRGCAPADFGSLRVVMTGAEKLPDRLAAAFEEHFGIRPLEGYGCTECAPAVAVNTHDFRSAGFRQIGAKRGKIGHPLPGVSVRIVSPENPWSGENLPLGQPGLMLVRGPNVMQGYLGKPEKTAEVLRDGWYVTGDVAALDEDGFLQITDRLSRFSKIGGEMVPHIKIEEKLHELAERDRTDVCRHRRAGRKEGRTARRAAQAAGRRAGIVSGETGAMRPAESLEAARRPVFPRGQFPAARHRQAGFAEGARNRDPVCFDSGLTRKCSRNLQVAFPLNEGQRPNAT